VGWGRNTEGQCFGTVWTEPQSGSRNVPVDASFSIGFSSIAFTGPEYAKITLKDAGGNAAGITKALNGNLITITPTSTLKSDTSYTLALPANSLRDAHGNPNLAHSFEYFTPDTLPPAIVSVEEPDGSPGSLAIRVNFDESVYPGATFGGITLKDAGGGAVDASVSIGGYRQRTLSITPVTALDLQQSYTLTLPAGALADATGNSLAAAVVLNIGGHPVPPSIPIAGATRFDTAVAASLEAYPAGSEYVVIATGRNWPDALGGAALAGVLDAPILLAEPTSLPASTKAEIERLGATHAVILGGTGAVSDAVTTQIGSTGDIETVERIAGTSRYQTADAVALRVIAELGVDYDGTAFVATGANFPDALAAAPLAAAKGWPLFLAHPTSGLTDATKAAMTGVDRVRVLGGTGAVNAADYTYLSGRFGDVDRLAGLSRYATAVAIADWGVAEAGLGWNRVGIATGENYPDALAGGVLQGKVGSVMVLTLPTSLRAETQAALSANAADIDTVTFFGGTGAVSDAVRTAVLNLVQ